MTDSSRYRAEVTGHFVQFFSRNTKTTTVRWHSRFKAEYHTLRDARAAKAKYESTGKILWPDDLIAAAVKPASRQSPSSANNQAELRL